MSSSDTIILTEKPKVTVMSQVTTTTTNLSKGGSCGTAESRSGSSRCAIFDGKKPDPCRDDQQVYLSLYAHTVVVRQVGDVVNWYFKITNLTDKTIIGPIDFFVSGITGPLATIDELPASGYYDLVINEQIDESDITRRFVVGTVWARHGITKCLIGNVVESKVAVELVQNSNNTVEFANPKLLITATETNLDIQASVDIINLGVLAVDSLVIDFSVIFGKDTVLSYLVNGLPSTIFNVTEGTLRLVEGQTIGANQRLTLLVTNVDKTISLNGYCNQACQSTVAWRFNGNATNNSNLAWEGSAPTPVPLTIGSGFSAVKLEEQDIPLPDGTFEGWAATPRDSNPLYEGTFNDGGFDEVTGVYTVPASGRYLLTATVPLLYTYHANQNGPDPDYLIYIKVDNNTVVSSIPPLSAMMYTPVNVINDTKTGTQTTVSLSRIVYVNAGANIVLGGQPSSVDQIAVNSSPSTPLTFSVTYLGSL